MAAITKIRIAVSLIAACSAHQVPSDEEMRRYMRNIMSDPNNYLKTYYDIHVRDVATFDEQERLIHVRIQEDLDDKLDRESRNSSNTNKINNNGGGQSQMLSNHALSFKRSRTEETYENDEDEDLINPHLALFNGGGNTDSQSSAPARQQQRYQQDTRNNSSNHARGRGNRNAHHRGGKGIW